MSDEDLWQHHAYVYALRRVRLGVMDHTSPIDPEGQWFAGHFVDAAERWMRGGKERPHYPPASNPDAVRVNWKQIPATALTDAERKLAAPEIQRMSDAARASIAAAEKKWKGAFRPKWSPTYTADAKEIAAPITAVMTEDRKAHLMGLLEKRGV